MHLACFRTRTQSIIRRPTRLYAVNNSKSPNVNDPASRGGALEERFPLVVEKETIDTAVSPTKDNLELESRRRANPR